MTNFITYIYYKCRSCGVVFVNGSVEHSAQTVEDCKLRTHSRDQVTVTLLPSLHRLVLFTDHQCMSSVSSLADLVNVETHYVSVQTTE